MNEADLARPVVQIKDLEDEKPVYEIYTYGEETVVIPIEEEGELSGAQRDLQKQLEHELAGTAKNPEIEFISDDHIRLMVDENQIPNIIGQGGENIDKLEEEVGLDITVEPRKKTLKSGIQFQVEERGNSLILDIGTDFSGDDVDVYDNEEFLFTATVGKNGEVALTKESDLAGQILGSYEAGRLDIRV